MVVYKAKNLYEGWTRDGIKDAKYSATDSGWFNMATFEQWYFEIFLNHVKDIDGPKVLIGDNHGSHFSQRVVASCLENSIRFVTILPNSTHLCQPLDVAVFKPLKILWRAVLDSWRKDTRRSGTIPKETFPKLLARAYAHVKGDNLVSGFKASGIVPLDSNQVFKRLPGCKAGSKVSKSSKVDESQMTIWLNEAVLTLLKDHCGFGPPTEGKGPRGKKVTPGKAFDIMSLEATWICRKSTCNKEYDSEDNNRWIVCDDCDKTYHFQCAGIDFDPSKYDEIIIESMDFLCEACVRRLAKEARLSKLVAKASSKSSSASKKVARK